MKLLAGSASKAGCCRLHRMNGQAYAAGVVTLDDDILWAGRSVERIAHPGALLTVDRGSLYEAAPMDQK